MAHDVLSVQTPIQTLPGRDDAAERWRKWEQRGLDNEARFARRARVVLVVLAISALGVSAIALWGV